MNAASHVKPYKLGHNQQGSRKGKQRGTALVVSLQQLIESLHMELVVAHIERGIDGLERLKVNVELLFLAILRHHCACVNYQPIWRHLRSTPCWNIYLATDKTLTAILPVCDIVREKMALKYLCKLHRR